MGPQDGHCLPHREQGTVVFYDGCVLSRHTKQSARLNARCQTIFLRELVNVVKRLG
jgi:hypothetical protein